MKFVRSAALAAVLIVSGCAFAQKAAAPKGFDIGVCGIRQYVGAFVTVDDKEVKVLKVSLGPDKVEDVKEPVVYSFDKEDSDGKHYVSKDKDQFIVLEKDEKHLLGSFVNSEGELKAVIFGLPDADGSKLADNAKEEYGVCRDLRTAPSADN